MANKKSVEINFNDENTWIENQWIHEFQLKQKNNNISPLSYVETMKVYSHRTNTSIRLHERISAKRTDWKYLTYKPSSVFILIDRRIFLFAASILEKHFYHFTDVPFSTINIVYNLLMYFTEHLFFATVFLVFYGSWPDKGLHYVVYEQAQRHFLQWPISELRVLMKMT